jgi:hypothetical protein
LLTIVQSLPARGLRPTWRHTGSPRYYMLACRYKLACGNVCDERGHTAATCPHRPCGLCGKLSNPRHTKRSCPSQHTGVRHCSDCGKKGHQRGPSCPKYQPPWQMPSAEASALSNLPAEMDTVSYVGPNKHELKRLFPTQRPGAPRGGQGMMRHDLVVYQRSGGLQQGQVRISDQRKRGRRSDYGGGHKRGRTKPSAGYSRVYVDNKTGNKEPCMIPVPMTVGSPRQSSMVMYYGVVKQKVTRLTF